MSVIDARDLALEVLLRVEGGAASDRALDRGLRRTRPERRDAALTTELVYGVLRRRQSLDRCLRPHSKRRLTDLDPAVRNALRLGVYQILFLDNVPRHAAVDSVVNAVKRRKANAAGFVNAVMRAFLRGADAKVDADGSEEIGTAAEINNAADLAARLDVPEWWAQRWQERYGATASAAWFENTLRPAALVLRAHPRVLPADELAAALAGEGVSVTPAKLAPGALRVTDGNPVGSPLLSSGSFTLRGEAGQLVASLLPVESGDRVLDACAGRGGKTIQIAEDTGARAVVAGDLVAWRLVACAAAAKAAAIANIEPVVADLAQPAPFRACFDAVIVDAPCSGLGTVRRHPELKWRNDPPRLERLAELQHSIACNAADTLVEGGRLLYVTCSTEPEENEAVVARLLEERPELRRRPVSLPPGVPAGLVGDDGYFRTYPGFPDVEGFFAALIEKTGRSRHAVE